MDPEIVPADLLVPPDAHGRGFDRHDAALVLDGYLRRLASQTEVLKASLKSTKDHEIYRGQASKLSLSKQALVVLSDPKARARRTRRCHTSRLQDSGWIRRQALTAR